ncbi:MAG: methylated-DNA--[protein]-cysteine S-methyltransferase [Alphaproteobacteria bacterium]|nr:methylated-DNA--[protein]-cysteine S-methyltransferase [Alphaproteobacteria bacterium]
MSSLSFQSPIGVITITRDGDDITSLSWSKTRREQTPPDEAHGVLAEAKAQLLAYFRGDLRRFDLSMSCPSTPFQHGVFESMMSIPYGLTKTYGEIAGYVDGSAQAVGAACGANPLPILIPCHRVVGASTLGGYSGAGGIESKVFLLRLEGGGGLLL